MYYPLAWYKGPDKSIDPFEQNRQKQVVGLIRTNFLKRFESSVAAFELSCDRLLQNSGVSGSSHKRTLRKARTLEDGNTRRLVTRKPAGIWGEDRGGRG
jgi:hypothetical protein